MHHMKRLPHCNRWLGQVFTLSIAILALCVLNPNLYGQSLTPEGDPEPSVGSEGSILNSNKVNDISLSPAQNGLQKEGTPQLTPNSAKVDKTFEGFGFDDNQTENISPTTGLGVRFIPPDPIGAAGKSRIIAVVNTMIEARTKDGKLKWRDSLKDFFSPLGAATLGTFTFDPKVVYDQFEDRFVVVTLEVIIDANGDGGLIDTDNFSRILLAVSKTHNPKTPTAADWHYHAIDSKVLLGGFIEIWADYPGFEVDEEAVYVTANMFTFVPFGLFGGVRLWIVDKGAGSAGFYDGGPAVASAALDPYAAAGIATTTMPAQVFGAGALDQELVLFWYHIQV